MDEQSVKQLDWGLTTAFVALLLFGVWHSVTGVAFNRDMLGVKTTGLAVDEKLESDRFDRVYLPAIDDLFRRLAPDGNLFIHFDGIDPAKDGKQIYVFFMRAAYVLHPRKVYVAPPDTPLTDAESIIANNSLPDDEWLRQNGIHYVMTFFYEDGQIQRTARRVETVPQ